MITKADYWALVAELEAIEKDTGVYLADVNADYENVDITWGCGGETHPNDPEFWSDMCRSAGFAAGYRAEDAGFDINKLLGRNIY